MQTVEMETQKRPKDATRNSFVNVAERPVEHVKMSKNGILKPKRVDNLNA